MKTLTNANEFLAHLKTKKTLTYEGIGLRANVRIIEPKNSKRAYCMEYWYKLENEWVKFSTIVSTFLVDIVKDFKEMELIYEPQ